MFVYLFLILRPSGHSSVGFIQPSLPLPGGGQVGDGNWIQVKKDIWDSVFEKYMAVAVAEGIRFSHVEIQLIKDADPDRIESYAYLPQGFEILGDGSSGRPVDFDERSETLQAETNEADRAPVVLINGNMVRPARAYERWSGLIDLYERSTNDPAHVFERILLPKPGGGFVEINDREQLGELLNARRVRHNRVNNARHIIDVEVAALRTELEGYEATIADSATSETDLATARTEWRRVYDLIMAFPFGARLAALVADDSLHAMTFAQDLVMRQRQVFRELEQVAINRLSVLTGQTITWGVLIESRLAPFDVEPLIALVREIKGIVREAATIPDVEAIRTDRIGDITEWVFDFAFELRQPGGGRGVIITSMPATFDISFSGGADNQEDKDIRVEPRKHGDAVIFALPSGDYTTIEITGETALGATLTQRFDAAPRI